MTHRAVVLRCSWVIFFENCAMKTAYTDDKLAFVLFFYCLRNGVRKLTRLVSDLRTILNDHFKINFFVVVVNLAIGHVNNVRKLISNHVRLVVVVRLQEINQYKLLLLILILKLYQNQMIGTAIIVM